MNSDLQRPAYLDTAAALRRRLAAVRFASGLRRSHLPAALLVAAAVLGLRFVAGWRSGEWQIAAALLGLWLLGAAVLAMLRLPGTEKSLRLLDRLGGWKDCFSSAWDFLNREEVGEAERLHLSRAGDSLAAARRSVPDLLPLPPLRKAWIAPVLAMALAFAPWGRPTPDARDLALTSAMKEAAAQQAEELRREAERALDTAALTEEERGELESLRVEVLEAAETLADPDGLTAGEVLEALENRARAAERLAGKLDAFSDDWASPEMLAEMGRHPDTADLALFIGDKAAEGAAAEATRLKEVLADGEIPGDTQERFTRALESISAAATEADRERPVGERFGNASRKLLDGSPATAAREFEELAKHFLELAAREEAKAKLDELARNLREAGGEIGGSELKKMEELAQDSGSPQGAPAGLMPLDAETSGGENAAPGPTLSTEGTEGDPTAAPQLAQTPGEQATQAPVPGAAPGEGESGEGSEGKPGEQLFAAPVPGEQAPEGQSGSGLGLSEQGRDGQGQGGMLSAPIPGMDGGGASPGMSMGQSPGASSTSGQGGDQAGAGSAEMVDAASEALKAASDARVLAQAGKDGESTIRAIEGQARAEQASRTRQEVVADFIAVEEQALDDQALPLSRRQQVLKYFSGIRAQFEKED